MTRNSILQSLVLPAASCLNLVSSRFTTVRRSLAYVSSVRVTFPRTYSRSMHMIAATALSRVLSATSIFRFATTTTTLLKSTALCLNLLGLSLLDLILFTVSPDLRQPRGRVHLFDQLLKLRCTSLVQCLLLSRSLVRKLQQISRAPEA